MAGLAVAFGLKEVFPGMDIKFSEGSFFLFILPPVIFAAGYTLKKKNFIRNLNYILALGVFGTIIAMSIISVILYYGNQYYYENYR